MSFFVGVSINRLWFKIAFLEEWCIQRFEQKYSHKSYSTMCFASLILLRYYSSDFFQKRIKHIKLIDYYLLIIKRYIYNNVYMKTCQDYIALYGWRFVNSVLPFFQFKLWHTAIKGVFDIRRDTACVPALANKVCRINCSYIGKQT